MTTLATPLSEQIAQLSPKERKTLADGYARLIELLLHCQQLGLRGKGVMIVALNPRVCATTRRFELFDDDGEA